MAKKFKVLPEKKKGAYKHKELEALKIGEYLEICEYSTKEARKLSPITSYYKKKKGLIFKQRNHENMLCVFRIS